MPGLSRPSAPVLSRGQILDDIGRELDRNKKCIAPRFVVLSVELDSWSATIASQGKKAGEDLVEAAAERIGSHLSAHDSIASLDSGKIIVLMEAEGPTGMALGMVDEMQRELMQGFTIAGRLTYTTASVGIAKVSVPYLTAEEIVWDADIAMRRARAEGKARAVMFRLVMDDEIPDAQALETDLRGALERNEFELHFQPIIASHTGTIEGFEAFLRWRHPLRGLQMPSDFIHVLKDTGLIVAVGEWVVREACAQAGKWRELSGRRIAVTINLAAEEFSGLAAIAAVNEAIDGGSDPGALNLEISEDALVSGLNSAEASLAMLRDRGVHVVLDDFSAGLSCFDCLRKLPIDAIKIDASFADRIAQYTDNGSLVRSIVERAHSLGLAVVAEGIERPGQLVDIVAMEFDRVQGYLISSPVDAAFASTMVETGWTPPLDAIYTAGAIAT